MPCFSAFPGRELPARFTNDSIQMPTGLTAHNLNCSNKTSTAPKRFNSVQTSTLTMRLCYALLWLAPFVAVAATSEAADAQIDNSLRGRRDSETRQLLIDGVTALRLIDSTTNSPVVDLTNGAVVDLAALGKTEPTFTIEALVSQEFEVIGSVKFSHSGPDGFWGRTENGPPYALCGDKPAGNFYECPQLKLGTHTVTATAWSLAGGKGEASVPFELTFSIVDVGPSPTVPTPPAPIPVPTLAPVPAPAPVVVTTPAPVVAPMPAPVPNPAPQPTPPTTPSSCKVPEFVGGWEQISTYPLQVTEAQGTLVGTRLVVTGGFYNGIDNAYRKNFYLDLDDPFGNWVQMPDLPIPDGYSIDEGTTHSAPVAVGDTYYQVGGLIGGAKPDHVPIKDVYKFDFTTMKWSKMPSLPLTIFGGGVVYEESTNQLIHSFGAYTGKFADSYDTWVLDLDNINAGWIEKKPATFPGNHLAMTTAQDQFGKKRHFFMGGQEGGNERTGNQVHLVEYIPSEDRWEAHKDMPIARGHASWSAEPISCGFILMGGTINALPRERTTDISYYDIATDTWTEGIAELPDAVASPVCAIYKDYVYCVPVAGKNKGFRRKIIVPS